MVVAGSCEKIVQENKATLKNLDILDCPNLKYFDLEKLSDLEELLVGETPHLIDVDLSDDYAKSLIEHLKSSSNK